MVAMIRLGYSQPIHPRRRRIRSGRSNRRRQYGLIEPKLTYLGCGRGSISSYPPSTAEAVARFARLVRLLRSIDAATIALFLEGFPVGGRGIKRACGRSSAGCRQRPYGRSRGPRRGRWQGRVRRIGQREAELFGSLSERVLTQRNTRTCCGNCSLPERAISPQRHQPLSSERDYPQVARMGRSGSTLLSALRPLKLELRCPGCGSRSARTSLEDPSPAPRQDAPSKGRRRTRPRRSRLPRASE